MTAFAIQNESCPKCGRPINSASDLKKRSRPPEVGDYAVCLWCATLLRFGRDFGLVSVTRGELNILRHAQATELIEVVNAVADARRR